MKRIELRLDRARNVWTHLPSGKSVCNWDEHASREAVSAQATKLFGEMFGTKADEKLGVNAALAQVEIVFVDEPLSDRETVPKLVKVTNFRREDVPIA
jgi:hypothetical protein